MQHFHLRSVWFPAALLLIAGAAPCQWSSTSYVPTQPVGVHAGLLVHENNQGIQVFSGVAQTWQLVSPPGSVLQGAGNQVVATTEAGGQVRGYSARLNASAVHNAGASASVFVGDDVATLLDTTPQGVVVAGYSSYTNAWVDITVPASSFSGVATNGAVITTRAGNLYHGFAARTGRWATYAASVPGRAPQARGNTVMADLRDPVSALGPRQIAAFSGILGTWTVSPTYTSQMDPALLQAANLVAVRTPGLAPNTFQQACYSAYRGAWSVSTVVHTGSVATPQLQMSIAFLDDPDPNARYEVFRAVPGNWSALTGTSLFNLAVRDDYVLVANSATFAIHAASGLTGNAWATINPASLVTSSTGGQHLGIAIDNSNVWAYLPAINAWAAPAPRTTRLVMRPGDAIAVMASSFGGDNLVALSTRWGSWVTGPQQRGGVTLATGSVFANAEVNSPNPSLITVFDERTDTWLAPLQYSNPGSTIVAGNLVVVTPNTPAPGPVMAYSSERGDWTEPAGAGAATATPTFGENLVWFPDNQGRIWAYSGMCDGHVWSDWPLSRDLVVPGSFGGVTPDLGYSVRGNPGRDLALVYASTSTVNPPIAVPGVMGTLGLNPGSLFFLGNVGVMGPEGVRSLVVALAFTLPAPAQVWLQPILVDVVTFQARLGVRAESSWLF